MKISTKYLLVASLYSICDMLPGMVMGAKENFTLMPVHAHLNLLGWIAVMLYGLSYQAFPKMAESKLASIQFYTVNAGVIFLIPALALLLLGDKKCAPDAYVMWEHYLCSSLIFGKIDIVNFE